MSRLHTTVLLSNSVRHPLLDPCDKRWTKTKHSGASAGIHARGYPFTAISVLSALPTKTPCSNRRGAKGHIHWCLRFRNVQTLELIIRTAEIFPKNRKKKNSQPVLDTSQRETDRCGNAWENKTHSVNGYEATPLTEQSIFSWILFWLLLLQTTFAHMTERSSWSPENSLEPHEPLKPLLIPARQFT